jgi:2-hydroxy-3-keto-5-methylthiopentenyl-1-phosphate phosphatase
MRCTERPLRPREVDEPGRARERAGVELAGHGAQRHARDLRRRSGAGRTYYAAPQAACSRSVFRHPSSTLAVGAAIRTVRAIVPESRRRNVVLDWDGTVTVRDTLSLVMERFGDLGLWRRAGRQMGRSLTHDEAVATGFATVRAPLRAVVDWVVANVEVRDGFAELAERYHPLVLSSGFRELIEPVLARERVSVQLLANRVEARPEGWRAVFREQAVCGHCGEPCKRASLPAGDVVYVGDGYSDRCAALAAGRVFARSGLARHLARHGVAHERFGDLRDVLAALDADAGEVAR